MDQTYPFTLSLSGGGLSALAYSGFVDGLSEHKIKPAFYAGLSGGAILAILLASGMRSEDIVEFFDELKSVRLLNMSYHKLEVVDHRKFIQRVRELLPYKNFDDLPTPTAIFVTDLVKKIPVLINSGDIASAVVASCSVFPLLQPVKRNGLLLGDGGFTTYYGAQFLRPLTRHDTVIGVDVTGISEGSVRGVLSALYKQINSSVASNSYYELLEAPVDLDVKINFPSPTIFSLHRKAPHLIELGRRSAHHHIPEIRKLVAA